MFHSHGALPLLFAYLDAGGARYTRVIEEDVKDAEPPAHVLEEGAQLCQVGDVDRERLGLAA
jgi:hypothetical protein